jgi:hypothetical protein
MILVYAGIVPSKPRASSPELDELRVRSKLLLHQLATKKAIVFLPTVAVAELLVPVPASQKGILIAALSERFVCPPFDLPASAIASDLWSRANELSEDMRYDSRHVLKADAMIVGCAKAAGATEFYSHDRRCRALAGLVMIARELPVRDQMTCSLWMTFGEGRCPNCPSRLPRRAVGEATIRHHLLQANHRPCDTRSARC